MMPKGPNSLKRKKETKAMGAKPNPNRIKQNIT